LGTEEIFALHLCVQIISDANPASNPNGTGDSFSGAKAAGHEADHSHPCRADIKKA